VINIHRTFLEKIRCIPCNRRGSFPNAPFRPAQGLIHDACLNAHMFCASSPWSARKELLNALASQEHLDHRDMQTNCRVYLELRVAHVITENILISCASLRCLSGVGCVVPLERRTQMPRESVQPSVDHYGI
jgi:hypothetical protein